MTTRESIMAIRSYLSMYDEDYHNTEFQSGEAALGPLLLFHYDYDNGGMTLLDLDYDEISSLNMKEMIELFPTLRDKAICSNCKGTKITLASHDPDETEVVDCECEEVIYPI
jgi:hypothetical protein